MNTKEITLIQQNQLHYRLTYSSQAPVSIQAVPMALPYGRHSTALTLQRFFQQIDIAEIKPDNFLNIHLPSGLIIE
jgi:hypothetical protein